MLDPDIAPLNELNRELARLQRHYRVASHEVGDRGARPDDIDDATLAWWVPAHRAMWRRRFELSETATAPKPVARSSYGRPGYARHLPDAAGPRASSVQPP